MLIWTLLISFALIGLLYLLVAQPATGKPGTSNNPVPTITTSTAELLPADTPIEGPFSARITIIEFLDYQCPACEQYQSVMRMLRQEFAGKIKFAVRQFPLHEIHPFADGAAVAALCAQKQNKFFDYSDTLFANRDYLRPQDLDQYAKDLGLDVAAFDTCRNDPAVAQRVAKDRGDGDALGIQLTPTIFMDGKMLSEPPTLDAFRALIKKQLGE